MSALPAETLLTDDEFDRLIGEGDPRVRGRVELRRGALRRMAPEYTPHMRMTSRLFAALFSAVEASEHPLEVLTGGSVRFGGGFTPMPDVFVGEAGVPAIPAPFPGAKVRLAVEIADATRRDDLGDKREDYGRAGLPELWVVDIQKRTVHRFHAPEKGVYTRADAFPDGAEVASATLPPIAVTVLFP